MQSPLIRRPQNGTMSRSKERGVTMALVAVAMATIIAMAALSIDIGTLYQSKAEAQRAADAGALTAARLISISGLTGDPTNGNVDGTWAAICGGATPYASQAALKVAQATQNFVDAAPASTVTVTYGAGSAGGSASDCSTLGAGFAINPTVTVTVKRINLPIFFAHVFSLFNRTYSGISVSATATAEAYNSSNSASVAGSMIPVQPRCVKPWIIPNRDPGNPSNLLFLNPFLVATGNGSIGNPGIYPNGVIGESFNINADCNSPGTPGTCTLTTPAPGYSGGILHYVPALISATPPGALPSGCALTPGYQSAIAGCDQTTVYACGTANAANYDLSENPVNPSAATGDTATAVTCLTHSATGGADTLLPAYPFQIEAGFDNPLVQQGVVNDNDIITTSNSIVTIPIYDSTAAALPPPGTGITIVGFLQVFINRVDVAGNVNVTVMNVSGCSNSATSPPVNGTSPVPVRLITPP